MLGLCPFMGVSNRLDTAIPMGMATIFVVTLSTIITHLLNQHVLEPFEVEYLRIVVFIVVIASVVQLTERYIRFASPLLHQLLGMYLPLITSNCLILGVVLTTVEQPLLESVALSMGAGIGFTLVTVLFASLRSNFFEQDVPKVFRGAPLAFLTVGIMALGFYGLKGIF